MNNADKNELNITDSQSFEALLLELEKKAGELRQGNLGLEDSTKLYSECVTLYGRLSEILKEARQKIEIYRPDEDLTEDFDEKY